MKIIFCIPGKTFSNNFLVSWTKLVKYCDNNNIEYELSNVDISIVHLARYGCLMIDPESQCGVCLNPFQKEVDYDYIMWIDSDMVFEPAHFEKLLKAEKRVITGLAKINRTNEYACFKKDKNERITDEYIKNNLDFDQIIWEFGTNENPNWVHVSYVSEDANRRRCLQAYKENGKTKYKII